MTAKALNYNQVLRLHLSTLDSSTPAKSVWVRIDKLVEIYCSAEGGAFLLP